MADDELLPDITNLSELLADAVPDMGMAQLKRHFRRHGLHWDKHDRGASQVVRQLASEVQQVRLQTGWDVRDVLWVIGCREHGTSLATEHLEDALHHVERLSGFVDDLHRITEKNDLVSLAFRTSPGDSATPLASMSPGPWDSVVEAAMAFAADAAFNPATNSERRPEVRQAVQALRRTAG